MIQENEQKLLQDICNFKKLLYLVLVYNELIEHNEFQGLKWIVIDMQSSTKWYPKYKIDNNSRMKHKCANFMTEYFESIRCLVWLSKVSNSVKRIDIRCSSLNGDANNVDRSSSIAKYFFGDDDQIFSS